MNEHQAFIENASRLSEAMADLQTEVTSEDHAVTVVVGLGGAVKALEFSRRASKMSGEALGALVVETINRGRGEVERQMSEVIDRQFGGHRPATGIEFGG